MSSIEWFVGYLTTMFQLQKLFTRSVERYQWTAKGLQERGRL